MAHYLVFRRGLILGVFRELRFCCFILIILFGIYPIKCFQQNNIIFISLGYENNVFPINNSFLFCIQSSHLYIQSISLFFFSSITGGVYKNIKIDILKIDLQHRIWIIFFWKPIVVRRDTMILNFFLKLNVLFNISYQR